ncbi:hypothetical protein LCGC14_0691390 [marine sediment metagenome]|uniref:Uncharacterized protein n=1 Tax=marine sediment metagenome TaxID=412755 RepID=A0A0F9T6I5_9ZZZZ
MSKEQLPILQKLQYIDAYYKSHGVSPTQRHILSLPLKAYTAFVERGINTESTLAAFEAETTKPLVSAYEYAGLLMRVSPQMSIDYLDKWKQWIANIRWLLAETLSKPYNKQQVFRRFMRTSIEASHLFRWTTIITEQVIERLEGKDLERKRRYKKVGDALPLVEKIVEITGFESKAKLQRYCRKICSKGTLREVIKKSTKIQAAIKDKELRPKTYNVVDLSPILAGPATPAMPAIEVEEIMGEILEQCKKENPAAHEQLRKEVAAMDKEQRRSLAEVHQENPVKTSPNPPKTHTQYKQI